MLCPHCNTDNASAFGYCSSCGKPLSTIDSAPPPPLLGSGTAAGVAPALAPAQAKRMRIIAMLGLLVAVAFIGFLGLALPAEGDTESMQFGFRIGRTFAAIALPALIAYVIAGRKNARKPNLFAGIFCGLGLLFTLSNAISSGALTRSFESPDQYVGRLMREAAGQQPVRNSLFPGARRRDTILRDQFRKVIQVNRDYMEAVNNTDISDVKKINSPESFVDPNYAAPALQQLHAVYALDSNQEEKLKDIITNMRQALEEQMSSSQRESFLRGFDNGVNAQLATRSKAVAAEKSWVESVDEEYKYATEHSNQFRMNGEQLIIQDSATREEFNILLRSQEQRRKTFLAAQQEFSKSQTQLLQKMGVSSQDVGAGK